MIIMSKVEQKHDDYTVFEDYERIGLKPGGVHEVRCIISLLLLIIAGIIEGVLVINQAPNIAICTLGLNIVILCMIFLLNLYSVFRGGR